MVYNIVYNQYLSTVWLQKAPLPRQNCRMKPNWNSKTSNLSAEVFATLKDRIIRWQYPPGHRFIEEQLCVEFKMSRSPVREALRMLVENGLVD